MANTRALILKSPLQDDLAVTTFQGDEPLGRLFQYDLELHCPNEEIKIDDILGQSVTVHFDDGAGGVRYFNGIVSSFAQAGQLKDAGGELYRATMRPWLWFLTRTADCRVFQQVSVPDIVKQVCKEQGFSDIEDKLNETHKPWDFCVQYRETDFNFISRLMEEEGIYYYFTHADGKHTLVLADSYSAHKAIRDDAVPFYQWTGQDLDHEQYVSSWAIRREIQPGAYALNDYDFRRPKAALRVREQIQKKHAGAEYEIYDYPGEYADRFKDSKGEYADLRIQELHVQHDRAEGVTDLRTMATGGLFKLDNHPRKDQNKEYLVVDAAYEIAAYSISDNAVPEIAYQCQFTVIDSQTPFRPARVTPKPVVQGPQTAIVVGPEGEDIWPDEYGRVKVQFYWDREGQDDDRKENSSCWVRVSQNWAGKGWGGMFIPHVGHEVIVSFLEGDPDRPIITGRVYNADNMPTEELPANKTKCVLQDHGGNHFIMNGAEGEEKIELRDKYGNELVMDAVEGTIRIYSPSHESEITLGKSAAIKSLSNLVLWFEKNKDEKIFGKTNVEVGGDVANLFLGAETKTTIGWKNRLIGGWKSESVLGAETKLVKGMKHDILSGDVVKIHKGKEYRHKLNGERQKSKNMFQMVGEVDESRKCERKVIKAEKVLKAEKRKAEVVEDFVKARLIIAKTFDLEEKINGKRNTKCDEMIVDANKVVEKAEKRLTKAKSDKNKSDKIALG